MPKNANGEKVMFKVSKHMLEKIDELIDKNGYKNRADVVREAVKNLIEKELE